MPIRRELRALYPADWPIISNRVRFERAGGRCERCGRPHGQFTWQTSDGRWRAIGAADDWRDNEGHQAPVPDIRLGDRPRLIRVIVGCAHRNHWPPDVEDSNLAALCARCHLLHDAPHHRQTFRARLAIGDLFTGPYLPPVIFGFAQT